MQVLVLFGGCSPEYRVSLASAAGVLTHLDRRRYTPVMVGVTAAGRWYHFTGDVAAIADDSWHTGPHCRPALLSPDRGSRCLLVFRGGMVERIPIDVVFPILHGCNGEDGTVQGLCELAGLPLVGCGTLASAVCMDKDRAHKLAAAAGVPVPRSFVLEEDTDEAMAAARAAAIGYPLFVKPVKAGSSYGITRVLRPDALDGAVAAARRYDDRVIVEEAIPGAEVGCAVMGNRDLIIGELDEIELQGGFFSYDEKYHPTTAVIHVPARLPAAEAARIKHLAMAVYRALDCRGLARVDLFRTPEGRVVFNEVNTIPGFTPHSRFPAMMNAAGHPMDAVVTRAIELAVEP